MSNSVWPHRRQPTRLPHPWDSPGKTLEWVAISFSNAWKWSHSVMPDSSRPHGLQPTRLLCPWDFAGKSTGEGCHKHYLVNWLNCMRRKLFLLKSKLGKAILTFWLQCKTSPFQSCMQQPGRSRCLLHHQLPIPTPELWVSLICRIKHLSISGILIPSPTLQALTYTCIFFY